MGVENVFHDVTNAALAKHILGLERLLQKHGISFPTYWHWHHQEVLAAKEVDLALLEALQSLHESLHGQSEEVVEELRPLLLSLKKMLDHCGSALPHSELNKEAQAHYARSIRGLCEKIDQLLKEILGQKRPEASTQQEQNATPTIQEGEESLQQLAKECEERYGVFSAEDILSALEFSLRELKYSEAVKKLRRGKEITIQVMHINNPRDIYSNDPGDLDLSTRFWEAIGRRLAKNGYELVRYDVKKGEGSVRRPREEIESRLPRIPRPSAEEIEQMRTLASTFENKMLHSEEEWWNKELADRLQNEIDDAMRSGAEKVIVAGLFRKDDPNRITLGEKEARLRRAYYCLLALKEGFWLGEPEKELITFTDKRSLEQLSRFQFVARLFKIEGTRE